MLQHITETWPVIVGLVAAYCTSVGVVVGLLLREVNRRLSDHDKRMADLKADVDAARAAILKTCGDELQRELGVQAGKFEAARELLKVELEGKIKEVDSARARDIDMLNTKHGTLQREFRRAERDTQNEIRTIHANFGRGKLYEHDEPRG